MGFIGPTKKPLHTTSYLSPIIDFLKTLKWDFVWEFWDIIEVGSTTIVQFFARFEYTKELLSKELPRVLFES